MGKIKLTRRNESNIVSKKSRRYFSPETRVLKVFGFYYATFSKSTYTSAVTISLSY